MNDKMVKSAFIVVQMAVSHATQARRAALHTMVSDAVCAGFSPIVGVDEVGAGALAGPVVAAAVLLQPPATQLHLPSPLQVDDSKKLTRLQREKIHDALLNLSHIEISIAVVNAQQVDEINVLEARFKAMTEAVSQLNRQPSLVFVDGNRTLTGLDSGCEQRAIVGGDSKVSLIAAASVIAKVTRDRYMRDIAHRQFPQYGFDRHVGYGTRVHLLALNEHGVCDIHRLSFKPVARCLQKEN